MKTDNHSTPITSTLSLAHSPTAPTQKLSIPTYSRSACFDSLDICSHIASYLNGKEQMRWATSSQQLLCNLTTIRTNASGQLLQQLNMRSDAAPDQIFQDPITRQNQINTWDQIRSASALCQHQIPITGDDVETVKMSANNRFFLQYSSWDTWTNNQDLTLFYYHANPQLFQRRWQTIDQVDGFPAYAEFSNNGKQIVCGPKFPGPIHFYELDNNSGNWKKSRHYSNNVNYQADGLTFAPDGNSALAVQFEKPIIDLWQRLDQTWLSRLSLQSNHFTSIKAIEFLPNQTSIAVLGTDQQDRQGIEIWEKRSSDWCSTKMLKSPDTGFQTLYSSPTESEVIAKSEQRFICWNHAEAYPDLEPYSLPIPPNSQWLGYSNNGKMLLFFHENKLLQLQRNKAGKWIQHQTLTAPDTIKKACIRPDSRQVILALNNQTALFLTDRQQNRNGSAALYEQASINTIDKKGIYQWSAQTLDLPLQDIEFSRDGTQLLSHTSESITLYNFEPGQDQWSHYQKTLYYFYLFMYELFDLLFNFDN